MIKQLTHLVSIYSISWALIFTSVSFAEEASTEPDLSTQAGCSTTEAREWSSSLNRCVFKKETMEERDEYKVCQKMEDTAERKKCHDDYAKNKAGELNNKKASNSGTSLATINLMLVAINWLGSKGKSSTCTSKTMFQAVAVGGVLAELYFKKVAKKELKKLVSKYKDEEALEDPFAAQVRSFEYLKDEQKAIKSYAKKRKTGYTLLSIGYLATAAVAAYEAIYTPSCGADKNAKSETKSESKTNTNAEAKVETNINQPEMEINSMQDSPIDYKEFNLDSDTLNMTDNFLNQATGMAFNKTHIFDKVLDLLIPKAYAFSLASPGVVAVIAGISSGLSVKLMKGAKKQMKEAQSNIETIDKVLEKFKEQLAGFCPSGRDDLSDTKCYCYLETGKKNPERSNSKTCQDMFAALNQDFGVKAGSYGVNKPATPGCLTIDKKFDKDCKCKKFKDKFGQNACMKSSFAQSGFNPSLGSALQLPKISKAFDNIYSGNMSGAGIDAGSLNQQLATTKKIRDQLRDKANKLLMRNGSHPIPSDEKLAANFIKKLGNKAGFKNARASSSFANARPSGMKSVLNKAMNKAGIKDTASVYGKRSNLRSGSSKKKGDQFRFSLDDSDNKVKVTGADDVGNENFDFNQNDISKDNGQSIFKLISNRYVTSGLKRLFEEEEQEDNE